MRDLVLLSGGLDSTTLLADRVDIAVRTGHAPPAALSVRYGQRHTRELDAATTIAVRYDVDHLVVDLTSWGAKLRGSAITDTAVDVPEGHYAHDSMRATVVPNRNATLLMAAAGIAAAHACDRVLTAVHAGDHPVYPDCRPEFIAAADRCARLGTDGAVGISAPYVADTKTAIASRAGALAVPIAATWSCYQGGPVHCGRCGTCVERREALHDAQVHDPTEYADPDYWRAAIRAAAAVNT